MPLRLQVKLQDSKQSQVVWKLYNTDWCYFTDAVNSIWCAGGWGTTVTGDTINGATINAVTLQAVRLSFSGDQTISGNFDVIGTGHFRVL